MTPERLYEILSKYAESKGIQLNNDKEYVLDILEGLLTNESRYGYRSCPCRLATGIKEKDADMNGTDLSSHCINRLPFLSRYLQ